MGLISLTQFFPTLISFGNLSYVKYILPERSSNEEVMLHHKSTLTLDTQSACLKRHI